MSSNQEKLRTIEIEAKTRVLDLFQGMYRSVFKGKGIEIEDIREYVAGDDVRSISWAKTAQMGRPFVKSFQDERDLTLLIAVDISASQNVGSHSKTKREKIAEIAALLAFSAIYNHDRVGLILFSDTIEKYVPPKRGLKHGVRLLRELLEFQPKGTGTNLKEAFSFLRKITKKPVISFVLSDFQAKDYAKSLLLAAKKDDLILIRMTDPIEKGLQGEGLVRFYDPETNESYLMEVNEKSKKAYEQAAKETQREVKEITKKASASLIELSTNSNYQPVLRAFFEERRRRK